MLLGPVLPAIDRRCQVLASSAGRARAGSSWTPARGSDEPCQRRCMYRGAVCLANALLLGQRRFPGQLESA